jgi:uncharacterized protein
LPDSLAEKRKNLEEIISREGRAAVACSGGVDSTLLLKITHDILGHENTIAVFADTPLLPPGESKSVEEVVNLIGSRLLTVSLDPLAWPEFTANPVDRCYLCKKKIYETFVQKLAEVNFEILMDGTNLDDLSDFRPGLKALEELNIRRPLADAGFGKDEIRKLSRELNLPNWNKHSSSCLATRIARDQAINFESLDLVRKCEGVLHDFGFAGCRVRISEDSAVIELLEEDIERFIQGPMRQAVTRKFNDFRIEKVHLNLSGRKGVLPQNDFS